jgi:hypothetical protein
MALTLNNHEAARTVQAQMSHVMLNDLRLMPPARWLLTERNGQVWLLAMLDRFDLRRPVDAYMSEHVKDTLQAVLGLPVVSMTTPWLAYAVKISGKSKLPERVDFPTDAEQRRDVFALGVGLHGEVAIPAAKLLNVIIAARQEKGKSNTMKLLVHQARRNNWPVYLCDPQGHTFNPDVWDTLAAARVARGSEDLLGLVARIRGELENREALFRAAAKRSGGIPPADVEAYNQVQGERMPRVMLAVDEANSLLEKKDVQRAVTDISRQGRKFGLHIILAGHNWRVNDISRELSGLYPIRIAHPVSDDTSAAVVLQSARWGKWIMGRTAGRAVLSMDGEVTPMQVYYLRPEVEAGWIANATARQFSPLTEVESMVVSRALAETGGRLSIPILTGWEIGEREARSMLERWEARGWVERDPVRDNARYITPILAGLASNRQTGQTASSLLETCQTGRQTGQTDEEASDE